MVGPGIAAALDLIGDRFHPSLDTLVTLFTHPPVVPPGPRPADRASPAVLLAAGLHRRSGPCPPTRRRTPT
jgi:hypothetical protein